MNCQQLINDFLMEYLDGALPLAQRAAFESHLALCPSCRNYLGSYRRTVELAKEISETGTTAPRPPEELIRAILASLPKQQ